MFSNWIARSFASAILLGTSYNMAAACTMAPDRTPPAEVNCAGIVNGQEIVQVALRNYTTFAETAGNCSCALNVPRGIGQVVSAQIAYSGTNIPLPGFSFFPSQGASSFPESNDWQGFTSAVSTAITAGENVDLVFFVVSRKPGLCNAVAAALQGAGLVAATDAAESNGKPIGKHMTYFKTEKIKVGKYKDCPKK